MQIVSEGLYEKIVRKCRTSYIEDPETFEEKANNLSTRLRELLEPFLSTHRLLPKGEDAAIWLNSLNFDLSELP